MELAPKVLRLESKGGFGNAAHREIRAHEIRARRVSNGLRETVSRGKPRRPITYAELAALDASARRKWLTKAEAADYAGVSERTLERAVARGELPRDGLPGKRLFRRSALDAWLSARVEVAALALATLLVLGVGCDVGSHACHRHYHGERASVHVP